MDDEAFHAASVLDHVAVELAPVSKDAENADHTADNGTLDGNVLEVVEAKQ